MAFFTFAFIKGPVSDESVFCNVGDTEAGDEKERAE